jgi:hypothetical protein
MTGQQVSIVEAITPPLVRQFVELPYWLYARDPHWVPELRRDARRRISRGRNPFFLHASMALFLAVRDGRPRGRVAAIQDYAHEDTHGERLAWFGFFEADDPLVARALLDAVERWGAAEGCTAVRGPANPSLNESAGLLIEGFDDAPYVLMPYNPPAYATYIEDAGYRKIKDLWAWDIDLTRPLGERIVKLAARVKSRYAVTVRALRMKAFEEDLELLLRVYRSAWDRNWGFVPPTDEEARQLAADLRPIVDPEIVLIAEIDGQPAACVVALPDVNQVLARMGGRLLPFGLWHFLRRKQTIDRGRLMLLGVVAEHRRSGLYPLLIAELHRRGIARGYRRAELSWTLEDNAEINAGIEAAGARHRKTYRLYEKPLG